MTEHDRAAAAASDRHRRAGLFLKRPLKTPRELVGQVLQPPHPMPTSLICATEDTSTSACCPSLCAICRALGSSPLVTPPKRGVSDLSAVRICRIDLLCLEASRGFDWVRRSVTQRARVHDRGAVRIRAAKRHFSLRGSRTCFGSVAHRGNQRHEGRRGS